MALPLGLAPGVVPGLVAALADAARSAVLLPKGQAGGATGLIVLQSSNPTPLESQAEAARIELANTAWLVRSRVRRALLDLQAAHETAALVRDQADTLDRVTQLVASSRLRKSP